MPSGRDSKTRKRPTVHNLFRGLNQYEAVRDHVWSGAANRNVDSQLVCDDTLPYFQATDRRHPLCAWMIAPLHPHILSWNQNCESSAAKRILRYGHLQVPSLWIWGIPPRPPTHGILGRHWIELKLGSKSRGQSICLTLVTLEEPKLSWVDDSLW